MSLGRGALICALLWPGAAAAADLSGEIGLVSDYRYRGVSLSDGKPAAQASLTLEDDSGFYLEAWSSTIDGPIRRFRTEVDLTGGLEKEFAPGIDLDLSATGYLYPSNSEPDYVELTAATTVTREQVAVKAGFSLVPRQAGTEHHGNRYWFAELAYELPRSPIRLTAQAGRENGWFDEMQRGAKWDWSLGAEARFAPARLAFAITGSNAPGERAAMVGSVFVAF